ncbi:MAG: hypothetical protein ACYCY2_03090 [Acidithiobacillus ferriphilus]
MIKQALTQPNHGNRATNRETVNGAIAINFEAIKKIVSDTTARLTPDAAEIAQAGTDAVNEALAQAQEREELQKRLLEHGFKIGIL